MKLHAFRFDLALLAFVTFCKAAGVNLGSAVRAANAGLPDDMGKIVAISPWEDDIAMHTNIVLHFATKDRITPNWLRSMVTTFSLKRSLLVEQCKTRSRVAKCDRSSSMLPLRAFSRSIQYNAVSCHRLEFESCVILN